MLISLLVAAILAGLVIWAVSQFPVDVVIVRVVRVVVVVVFVLYTLKLLGLWNGGFAL